MHEHMCPNSHLFTSKLMRNLNDITYSLGSNLNNNNYMPNPKLYPYLKQHIKKMFFLFKNLLTFKV